MGKSWVRLPDRRDPFCGGVSSVHTFWKKGRKHLADMGSISSMQVTSRRTHYNSQQTTARCHWNKVKDASSIFVFTRPSQRPPERHISNVFVSTLVSTRAHHPRPLQDVRIRAKAGFDSQTKRWETRWFQFWGTGDGIKVVSVVYCLLIPTNGSTRPNNRIVLFPATMGSTQGRPLLHVISPRSSLKYY